MRFHIAIATTLFAGLSATNPGEYRAPVSPNVPSKLVSSAYSHQPSQTVYKQHKPDVNVGISKPNNLVENRKVEEKHVPYYPKSNFVPASEAPVTPGSVGRSPYEGKDDSVTNYDRMEKLENNPSVYRNKRAEETPTLIRPKYSDYEPPYPKFTPLADSRSAQLSKVALQPPPLAENPQPTNYVPKKKIPMNSPLFRQNYDQTKKHNGDTFDEYDSGEQRQHRFAQPSMPSSPLQPVAYGFSDEDLMTGTEEGVDVRNTQWRH